MPAPTSLFTVLAAGARVFNRGQYFEAHELLEDGLDEVPDAYWELVVGLIQIAVGYHKLTQQLWRGGASMLERALTKVAAFPDDAGGIDLGSLRQRVRSDCDVLRAGTFDARAFTAQPPRMIVRRKR